MRSPQDIYKCSLTAYINKSNEKSKKKVSHMNLINANFSIARYTLLADPNET